MIVILRSLVFDFFFYVGTAIYLSVYLPLLPFLSRKYVYGMYRNWTKWVFWMLKHIVGLSFKVVGKENLKTDFCLIACKHQSAWETLVFSLLLDDFYLVLKKELISIPIYGRYLTKLESIVLDREKGALALKHMYKQIKEKKDKNIPFLIFPEGNRKDPNQRQSSYQPGLLFLYKNLDVAVCPVAHNAGCFWKRKAFIKRPGIITIKILKPIEPKNPMFEKILIESLESETAKLVAALQ